ncbi:N-acetylmuramic acid 6-phosphate etherase [Mitsuokella jalaludinii]|uniref:N-acetylmuramic acid 6-phosphate etherase n=1 Tax=Mitsuokella jalaludinii TaxID=187979 RepID=UPI00241C3D7D|nr:N-acetylmuramic acid 6-phosphate etherase [Mitsuokella jalaludinii]MEE0481833.1 N-acetylmuramic acid 6-phosphate etherase [Mitsuokella jalaludinii]
MDLSRLTTERRNPASAHIDSCTTLEMVTIMQQEDSKIASAIKKILPEIARAIDATSQRLENGGRLFYLGAGTSGRLGILDASECPPTYGTDPELVQGLIAGGIPAIFRAQEGAEDNPDLAVHDLKEHGFSAKDVLVGIAASGRTPYVIGGLKYARELGALTIALACSEHAEIAALADIALTPVTGPEVVTGSTRMKAGTAQKLVLNMLSTGTMIKLGKVYGNLMVDVKASNKKLEERAIRIVMEGSGCERTEAEKALKGADGHAKLAILMVVAGVSAGEGKALLERTAGHLAAAIRLAAGGVKA